MNDTYILYNDIQRVVIRKHTSHSFKQCSMLQNKIFYKCFTCLLSDKFVPTEIFTMHLLNNVFKILVFLIVLLLNCKTVFF